MKELCSLSERIKQEGLTEELFTALLIKIADLEFIRVRRPVREVYDTRYLSMEEFDMFLKEAQEIIKNLKLKLTNYEKEIWV